MKQTRVRSQSRSKWELLWSSSYGIELLGPYLPLPVWTQVIRHLCWQLKLHLPMDVLLQQVFCYWNWNASFWSQLYMHFPSLQQVHPALAYMKHTGKQFQMVKPAIHTMEHVKSVIYTFMIQQCLCPVTAWPKWIQRIGIYWPTSAPLQLCAKCKCRVPMEEVHQEQPIPICTYCHNAQRALVASPKVARASFDHCMSPRKRVHKRPLSALGHVVRTPDDFETLDRFLSFQAAGQETPSKVYHGIESSYRVTSHDRAWLDIDAMAE